MMMQVLGIDPGPSKCGYCLLDYTIKSSPIWLEGGTTEDLGMLLDTTLTAGPGMLVVIERPRAVHNPMANVQVVATAWAGGEAYGAARARGFNVLDVGVNEWRTAFVGNSKRGDNVDKKVEAELRRQVRQMPARTSAHARDAGGVACVGARIWFAGRYSNPRVVSLAARIRHAPNEVGQ
jgi:Holliday junction resolvasome RuvABC endonuclease subunit